MAAGPTAVVAVSRAKRLLPILLLTATAGTLGVFSTRNAHVAVVLAVAVLFVSWLAPDIARLSILCLASTWLVQRAPAVNVSYSDILVAVTGAAAVTFGVHRRLQSISRLLFVTFGAYLASLAVSLTANAALRSDFEFAHRIALVGGAVLAGAWAVQRGVQHQALRLLLVVSVVVSAAATEHMVRGGIGAAYPLGYQKNFAGSLLAQTLMLLLIVPREFRIKASWLRVAGALVLLGLVASQSRGGMLEVVIGAAIWLAKSRHARRRATRLVALVIGLTLAVGVGLSVRAQLNSGTYTSLTQRFVVEAQTQKLWEQHPWTGVGLKYFVLPEYAGYQAPNNVLDEALAEGGFPALAGFAIFMIGSLVALSKSRGSFAVAGLALVAGHFAHGMVDIYWSAGTVTLAWIVAGMALSAPPPSSDPDWHPLERTELAA